MMGKAAQRKNTAQPGAAPDIHEQIAAEAAAVRAKDRLAFQPADKTPALCGLLDSATEALQKGVPATFDHLGRRYFLRVMLAQVNVMIFETATAPEPMALAVTGSSDEFGHLPYH